MFLFLLNLYNKGTARSTSYIGVHVSFGFLKGGTYNLEFTANIPDLMVGLLSSEEYRELDLEDDSAMVCNSSSTYPYGKIGNHYNFTNSTEIQVFNGTIEKKDVYYLVYHGCANDSYSITYEYTLRNPGGNIMDYRRHPLIYITPVTFVIVTCFMVYWFINWFCNFSVQIYLHYFFSAFFILSFLTNLFYLIYIQVSKTNDTDEVCAAIYVLFDVLKDISFLVVTMLAMSGWCYIVDTIKLKNLLMPILIGTLLAIVTLISNSLSMPFVWTTIVLIIDVALYVVYVVYIFKGVRNVSNVITAHSLVIQNAGIDPSTTPLQKKKEMFQQYQYVFIAWLILFIVRLFINIFTSDIYWIDPFLEQLINIIVVIAFGIIFRIRNKDNDGYTAIGDGNGEEFVLSDIESAAQSLAENEGTGKKWEPGTPLPSQPVIVKSPTVIVLESPEGVEEVALSPEQIEDRPSV